MKPTKKRNTKKQSFYTHIKAEARRQKIKALAATEPEEIRAHQDAAEKAEKLAKRLKPGRVETTDGRDIYES